MNEERAHADVKAGIFVVAASLILVAGVLWISGSSWLHGKQSDYWVLMKNAGGLRAGDVVRITGVDVGKIRQVGLDPAGEWPVRFRVSIDAGIALHSDAAARVARAGLLSAPYLEVEPGNAASPVLSPGAAVPGRPSPDFQQALAQLSELSVRAAGLITRVSEELPVVIRRFGALSEQASSLTGDVHRAFGPGGRRIADVLDATEQALQSTANAMTVVNENRDDLGAAMDDLRDAAANIRDFARLVRERPYSLVRIAPEPDRRPGDAK